MALDNNTGVQWDLQFLADFRYSLALMFPSAVCEQYKRDPAFLQGTEGVCSAGNRFGGTEENTVNAEKREGKKRVGCEMLRDLLESERDIWCCWSRLEASRIIERPPGH